MTLRLAGLLLKDPRSRGQEFEEECDNNVLMAYGRCLRPALYSSLRSSPSHPTGVSALRVTIAIANARKQWGLGKSTAKSQRLFRNEPATSRRVRAGAIERSAAMTRTAFCRKSPRVPRVCWLGSWALGTSDRETTTGTTAERLFKSGFEKPVHEDSRRVAESGAWCNDLGVRCYTGELQ